MKLADLAGIGFDVDGVLTDGGFWWGASGEELKRFSFADVMGISLARKAGLAIGLISGEASPLIERFAQKLGIVDFEIGCKDKASALASFAARNCLAIENVAFMGDDVNDLGAMRSCGLAAAPADARPVVRAAAAFVSTQAGGNGAAREFIDAILSAKERS